MSKKRDIHSFYTHVFRTPAVSWFAMNGLDIECIPLIDIKALRVIMIMHSNNCAVHVL